MLVRKTQFQRRNWNNFCKNSNFAPTFFSWGVWSIRNWSYTLSKWISWQISSNWLFQRNLDSDLLKGLLNTVTSSFFCPKGKKALAKGRSPPVELEVSLRSGPYLLIKLILRNKLVKRFNDNKNCEEEKSFSSSFSLEIRTSSSFRIQRGG